MCAVLFDRKIGTEKYKSKIINQNQMVLGSVIKKICGYADTMVEIAVQKITDGCIAPNPIDEDICKFCMVKSVCPRCEMARRGNMKVDFNSFELYRADKMGKNDNKDDAKNAESNAEFNGENDGANCAAVTEETE
jgi:hypothetical protein